MGTPRVFEGPGHFSPSNYSFAAGHFSAVGEATAKSLFLGGVLGRFPALRIGLLEGGVAVGVRVYGDLVSRYVKRTGAGLGRLDPARRGRGPRARVSLRAAIAQVPSRAARSRRQRPRRPGR